MQKTKPLGKIVASQSGQFEQLKEIIAQCGNDPVAVEFKIADGSIFVGLGTVSFDDSNMKISLEFPWTRLVREQCFGKPFNAGYTIIDVTTPITPKLGCKIDFTFGNLKLVPVATDQPEILRIDSASADSIPEVYFISTDDVEITRIERSAT